MALNVHSLNWNHLRSFLAVGETGSFSEAGRAIGLSQPTLGRQVRLLEQAIGLPLFIRRGVKLELTDNGRELLRHVRQMREAATHFSLAAAGRSQEVKGEVVLSAGELFAAYCLPPIIEKLRRENPQIEIIIRPSNRSADLKRREADIAVRANYNEQPGLYASELPNWTSRPYASKTYLEDYAASETGRHRFIGFDDSGRYGQFLERMGIVMETADFSLTVDSHLAQWVMAKQGIGIVMALEIVGDADDSMQRVWPDIQPVVTSTHLVAHAELLRRRHVEVVFEHLREALAAL